MIERRFTAVVVCLLFVLGCNGSSSKSSGLSSVAGTSTGPGAIEVSPSSLDYGDGLIGDPRTLDLRVRNGGDGFLDVVSIVVSQGSSPGFSITSGPTSVVIAPLAEIVVSVTYVASAEGPDAGILEVRSDDPDTPMIDVPLLGSGIPIPVPDVDVSPLSLAFGDVFIGSSSSLEATITNRGSATLDLLSIALGSTASPDFSLVSTSANSLGPGATSTVQVQYAPGSMGADAGQIVVLSNDADHPRITISLSGNGVPVPAPDIDVTPASLDFADVFVGSSSTRTVTVSNKGTAVLNVLSTSFGAATSNVFSMSSASPGAIVPGASVTVQITYAPIETMSDSATLRLQSDDPDESEIVVSLSGTGVAQPVADVDVQPTSLDFGQVPVGERRSRNVTLSNSGSATLNVTSVVLGSGTASDFTITRFPSAVINPGGSSRVSVRYEPDTDETDSGTLRIETDDPDEGSIIVSLMGMGSVQQIPEIEVSPQSVVFGSVLVGSSKSLGVTIANIGNAPLDVTSIGLGAASSLEMLITSGSAGLIAAGDTLSVTVEYAPNDVGSDTATLIIASDDADEPTVTLSLSGDGFPTPVPEILVTPGALDFGTIVLGNSSSLQVSISNTGGVDLGVTGVFFEAQTSLDFTTITGFTGGSIGPGLNATFQVTYSPTDEVADSGRVVIESDDSDEAVTTVSISGQGLASDPGPQSMTLAWDSPTLNEDNTLLNDLAGFKIYLGNSPGTYSNVFDVGNVNSATLSSLSAGTYYVVSTAYDLNGNESDFSGEVVVTLPIAAP